MAGSAKASQKLKLPVQKTGTAIERKRAEADALFLSIGEGAIVIDSAGKISRINQPALELLGYTEEDVLGKWYPGTIKAVDESGRLIPHLERPIAEVFLRGEAVFRKMYFRKKDGSRIAVALTVSPILHEGKPTGAIEIFRDITEEVRLEKAKDEFISLASHQLRTPATGVKQYLGMLLEGYAGKLTDQQRQFLNTANLSNDRQLRIIDDLLRVAAADAGNLVLNKSRVDLVPLIESVIEEQAANFADKNQNIVFLHAQPEVYADVDRNSFRMVLENLIDNAHKYTYEDKKIEVKVRQLKRHIVISVKDEGTGIDPSDIDKLFQKFSRLDNPLSIASGGTGLGLYWVKQIVDLHCGIIKVDSEPDKGTTFIIKLEQSQ